MAKYTVKLAVVIDSEDYKEGEISCAEEARDAGYTYILESNCIKNKLEVKDEKGNDCILVW